MSFCIVLFKVRLVVCMFTQRVSLVGMYTGNKVLKEQTNVDLNPPCR